MRIKSITGHTPQSYMLTLIIDIPKEDILKMENDTLYAEYILKKYEQSTQSRFNTFMYELFKRY